MQNSLRRERFQACLEHRQADRLPLTLGSPSCSLHRSAHAHLLDHLGFKPVREAPIIDSILQIVEPDPRILEFLDIDVLWLLPDPSPAEWGAGGLSYVDELGRRFAEGGGFFNQVESPPRKAAPGRAAQLPLSCAHPERVGKLPLKARSARQGFRPGSGRAVGHLRDQQQLAGRRITVDLALNLEYAGQLAERVLENTTCLITRAAGVSRPGPMVMVSDDLGSQNR
jgi:hypothetical protein